MKVFELRAYLKERGIRGYSTMKKGELAAKVKKLKEQDKVEKYDETLKKTAVCCDCLEQQRIQRKIDKKMYDQRLFESAVRTLVCEHCQHVEFTVDEDQTVCASCGALQAPDGEGDFFKSVVSNDDMGCRGAYSLEMGKASVLENESFEVYFLYYRSFFCKSKDS